MSLQWICLFRLSQFDVFLRAWVLPAASLFLPSLGRRFTLLAARFSRFDIPDALKTFPLVSLSIDDYEESMLGIAVTWDCGLWIVDWTGREMQLGLSWALGTLE